MKKYFLPLLALSLTACSSQVDSATFSSKAQEAEKKEHSYTGGKAVAKGNYVISSTLTEVDEEYTYTYDKSKNKWDVNVGSLTNDVKVFVGLIVDNMIHTKPSDYISDKKEVKYYASSSEFKIVDETNKEETSYITFNSYGLITALKVKGSSGSDKFDFNIKYSYTK